MRKLAGGGLMALFCLSGAVQAGFLTDDENAEPWKEAEVTFPPPPKETDLLRFYVGATNPNAFLIDLASLSVSQDGVVRYVLVVRSPRGAENVTFEGIRCASGERRIYAVGQSDGTWVASRNVAWEVIPLNAYNRPQATLAKEYFCDGTKTTVLDVDEARLRLKRGTARGFNPVSDEQGRM